MRQNIKGIFIVACFVVVVVVCLFLFLFYIVERDVRRQNEIIKQITVSLPTCTTYTVKNFHLTNSGISFTSNNEEHIVSNYHLVIKKGNE